MAVASASGLPGFTRRPVRRSSTISGTAAARHPTTGSPAAIASANTMPNPSCTVGRQKQCAHIFYRQRRPLDLSQEYDGVPEAEPAVERAQAHGFRPFPYDANLDPWDSRAEDPDGLEQIREPLARIHPRHREHGRSGRRPPVGAREAPSPLREVDRLRHDRQLLRRDAVHLAGHGRRVAARDDDAVGAPGVEPLPVGLDPQERPDEPALVPELVGDDALEHDDERAAPRSRPEEPVEVNADDHVALGRRAEDAHIVEPAVEGMKGGPHAQGAKARDVAETLEAPDQAVQGDEGAAAREGRERRGGEEGEPHAGG